ncbi:MAG: hypothetical protein II655_01030, partial [Thermoguttaceae bacterium]|nr:hypothetical protein [Thermoguttaceae bacterium]
GVLRAWDFEPNDEDGFDVASLSGADAVAIPRDGRSRLCLRREGLRPGLCSFVDEQERWFVPDVKEFRLWQAPDGKERCLALDKDGKLLALDIETGSATSTPRDLAQGFPKNGFRDLATSPDGKALAGVAADSKNVFVFDHNDATPKWTSILDADVEADVYQIDFSVDSAILGVATQFGEFSEIRLWDAQRKFFLASEGGDSLKASQNVALNATCGKLRFIDERFAVYTGRGNDVSIFDVKKRALHQRLEAPIVSALARKLYTISGVASLNQGIGRDKATTFVIGGPDGILRFYQFSPERELFDNVWNISWLQFDRIVKSKLSPRFDDSQDDADDTQIDENLTNDASDNDLDLSKFGVDLEDIDDTQNDADDIGFDENLPNDASDNDFDLSKFDVDLDDIDVLPYQFRDVNDLYVSSDGKTLYVSTLDGVRAYDLEKIWKKIETVGQNWDAESVEHATGLRTTPTGSLETTLRNRLQRVEE